MRRIGIAASRIAKGNLTVYNIFVIVLSTLCSIMLFFICSFSILMALLLISFVLRFIFPAQSSGAWVSIVKSAMVALSVVIGVLNILAVVKNIKFKRRKI